MNTNTEHACTHDDQHRVVSDSGSEGGSHDRGRRLVDPTRTSRHLMSLTGRHPSDLGDESTRNVVGMAADRHGSPGSTDRGVAQIEQPRQMEQCVDTMDGVQNGYDPSGDDLDLTTECDIGSEVDRQTVRPLVGSSQATEEQLTPSLAGNLLITEEQRSATMIAGFLPSLDHLYSSESNFESCLIGTTARSTSTPTDGHCSDETSDSQFGRMMTSPRDLTADDGGRRSEVDAWPLEATRVGRGVRCTAQTDSEVGRQYEASLVGRVVDESFQQVENCSTGDALPLEAVRFDRGFRCTDQSDMIEVGRPYDHGLDKLSASFQNVSFTQWNRKYIVLRTYSLATVMVMYAAGWK